MHRFVVVFVLRAGARYSVSGAKASNNLSFLTSASVIVAFEIFHLLLWVQHFFKYTHERSRPTAAPRITPPWYVTPRPDGTTRRVTCDDVCDRVHQNSTHK